MFTSAFVRWNSARLLFSLFFPSFHFLAFMGIWVASCIFMDRSRNVGSGEVDVRSPFWRNYGILGFPSFVD
jgi:hypothetical protein